MKNITAKVNTGRSDSPIDISFIEKKYNARYVGQLALKTVDGNWAADVPGEVFYQEHPPYDYSNYMALIIQRGKLYITSGSSGVEGVLTGVEADNGEIIYSRARHDYRVSTDKSVWIDGGRDYVRSGSHGRFLQIKIINGDWFELEPEDADYESENKI